MCVRKALDSRLTFVSHEIVSRMTLAVITRRRKAFVDSCIASVVAVMIMLYNTNLFKLSGEDTIQLRVGSNIPRTTVRGGKGGGR